MTNCDGRVGTITGHVTKMENWVCPNDRQLALRAKLGAGWSVHTSKATSFTKSDQLSLEETDHIMNVIRQAELLDQHEMKRIGLLVEKVENMRRNILGNGSTQCILCGDGFGLLGASPLRCIDCNKSVCSKCSVDTLNGRRQSIWLCKICSEQRELWKRSGAWFYKGLPHFVLPASSSSSSSFTDGHGPDRSRVDGASNGGAIRGTRINIVRPIRGRGTPVGGTKNFETWNSSSMHRGDRGSDHSSDSDDEVHVVVSRQRVKPVADSGDSDSLKSSCVSARLNRSGSSVTSGSQWSVTESAREGDDFDSSTHIHPTPLSDSSVHAAAFLSATHLTTALIQDCTATKPPPSPSARNSLLTLPSQSRPHPPPSNPRPVSVNVVSSIPVPEVPAQRQVQCAEEDIQAAEAQLRRFSVAEADSGPTLGTLEFTALYNSTDLTLSCIIRSAKCLPAMDSNGLSDPYVKLHLLPGANKSTKLRTTTKPKTLNPVWNETLVYNCITDMDVVHRVLRLSVYDEDPIGREFIGETRVPLRTLKPGIPRDFNVYLAGLQVEKMEAVAEDDRGRILLGLMYNTSKEQLHVSIKRCAALKAMDSNGYSDPYVKLYLVPDPKKKTKLKTKVKNKTLNPEFNEEFIYSIKLPELAKKSLIVTVWDRDFGKFHDYIGGIVFGIDAKGDLLRHWFDMIKNPNNLYERWHFLSPEEFPSNREAV